MPLSIYTLIAFLALGLWLENVGGKPIGFVDHVFTPLPMLVVGFMYIIAKTYFRTVL